MPKIIGDSLADHRELTRNRLFDALASLLAEQPFDSISMSQIASRAKVGRTAVYNHFPDKEVLLLEFMRRVTVQFSQKLQELHLVKFCIMEKIYSSKIINKCKKFVVEKLHLFHKTQ